MPHFQHKPHVIEAVQWRGWDTVSATIWTIERWTESRLNRQGSNAIHVETLDGNVRVNPGDWIAKTEHGLAAIKEHLFMDYYEPVEDSDG